MHVASKSLSKFQLITELNSRLGLGIDIKMDESVVINRSLRASDKLKQFKIEIQSWDQMLDNFCKDQATYDFVTR